jgi:energy-coupling factor transport system substrate-specific component
VAPLAGVGAVTGFAYGALVDVQSWVTAFRGSPDVGWTPGMAPPAALAHFARYYVLTSLGWDAFRAAGNVILVVALGLPVLAALRRLRARMTVEIVPPPR